ncbi:bifunctional sugar-1-phosphate nucleotidylyltransferase/acetyltransferase [Methanosphaera sp.]|jgi:UDP-N-acetylglucosamine diphosphorylase/glucosamine-1-phosphate N-acetyltransferase|uniref:bifunctional sugar-1-phosphate nucleotidylyltransferase/acetyltransferase n=1 Tax=Methanosphaera sp. TaxID=2666342 RepID=UPI002A4EA954|nr:sugar phosphate nucleotidyltransferase [Methanobacteriaceae archaeon]MDY2745076.1 bifunctional sugar-1-phosphate nucleotidylyltransferase/acetyltransferase [Methanosphaera sp.]
MKAIILTAGEGTRMRPLTTTRPKTMLITGGKPLIQYNIESLRDAGIKDITLVVGYKKEVIEEYFGDGSKFGVNINYAVQEGQLGTAHAIGSAEKYIDESFIVLNGDIIVSYDLIRNLIEKYATRTSNNVKSVLTLIEVDNPSNYGVVSTINDKIVEIVEKPAPGEAPSNLANAGIYLFSTEIFDAIRKTELSERGEYEITDSLKIELENGWEILGLISHEPWMDVGRPWELLKSNQDFLEKMEDDIEGEIEENVTIHGPLHLGKGSIIRSGCYIQGPVFIGENCDVGPNTYLRPYACLCNDVDVGNAVEIKNSIIMDGTNVNHLSYVGDSVIGVNCNLGAGTNLANLRFDDQHVRVTVKGKRVDSGLRKLGAIFGDGVKTGINTSVNPGVKIGNGSFINAGCVLYRDIDSYSLVSTKTNLIVKEIKHKKEDEK